MLTSRNNPTIKHIRALRQRKERESSGTFWIEGIRIVAEALQLGAAIEHIVVAPDQLHSAFGQQLVEQARAQGCTVIEVSAEVFASLSSKEGPQGLGAVVRQHWSALADISTTGLGWIALNAVSDPGNLGTILRTSDAVGASGVMLIGATTDPFDPGTVRASMGALFSQRLIRTTWAEFADWKAHSGWSVVGAADSASCDYQDYVYPQPLIVLMGSEREGLSLEQQALCDAMVSIPMVGRSDSLNLAVATSVLVYEVFNQQRRRGQP